ncbi:neutral zinc metallopeptidase [Paracoccus pacificus]|uniref:Neutral zinc metallopeptidase n=1 Tax=Paracoccus pacificus TaxID=1463598 RepID=A0ABW4RAK6_9RHOB
MEWRGRRGSGNIDDRRGMSGGAVGGIGLVGTLAILAVGYFFGIDISPIVAGMEQQSQQTEGPVELTPEQKQEGEFMSVVLGSTEQVWDQIFKTQLNETYTPPVLVLYSGMTQSGCGGASAMMGPFYCPVDKKLYLDTDFFKTMRDKMGAGGDFAAAYVVAHEVGHHVQDLMGTLNKWNAVRQRASEQDSNAISVLIELQADCYAGVWGNHEQQNFQSLTEQDVRDAVNAAAAVGDDTLQKAAGRSVNVDSFTHGSAAQRQEWFMRGFKSGEVGQCDTFKAAGL